MDRPHLIQWPAVFGTLIVVFALSLVNSLGVYLFACQHFSAFNASRGASLDESLSLWWGACPLGANVTLVLYTNASLDTPLYIGSGLSGSLVSLYALGLLWLLPEIGLFILLFLFVHVSLRIYHRVRLPDDMKILSSLHAPTDPPTTLDDFNIEMGAFDVETTTRQEEVVVLEKEARNGRETTTPSGWRPPSPRINLQGRNPTHAIDNMAFDSDSDVL